MVALALRLPFRLLGQLARERFLSDAIAGAAPLGGPSSAPRNRAARFRQSMWNDICSWIGEVDSAFGSHSLCP